MAAASRTTMPRDCGEALRGLLAGHWAAWSGLHGGCSLRKLERQFGGSAVLDSVAYLGSKRVACTRSSLENVPVTVWHVDDRPLLVECDFLSAPLPGSNLDQVRAYPLDIIWGAATLEGGELVMPEHGLALIVVRPDAVVGCRGFPPMNLETYLASTRPRLAPLQPKLLRGTR